MKKIISIILVAAIMLGFIAMTISVASAEVLQSVAVTGVTAPVVGQTATTDGIVCSDPNVTLVCDWYCLSDGKADQAFEGVFQENKTYALTVKVTTSDDMEMDREDTVFTIDGHAPDYVKRYWGSYFDIGMVYELGQVQRVDTVVIEQMPQLQVGQSVTQEQVFSQLRLAEGLQAGEYRMTRYNGEYYEIFTAGTLEATCYRLHVNVTSVLENGYLNGMGADVAWPDVPGNAWVDLRYPGKVEVIIEQDLRTKIESVDVTGVTVPMLGEEFTTEGIVVPEGLEMEASWWNSTDDKAVQPGEKMVSGKEYCLNITAHAKPGYCLAVEEEQILVNGMSENDVERLHVFLSSEQAFDVEWYFSIDTPVISKVQLDGVPDEIQPGAAPALDVKSMHPQVKVTNAQWLDTNGDPVTTFAAGKSYLLAVEAQVDEAFRAEDWTYLYTRSQETEECFGDGQQINGYFLYTTAEYVELKLTGTGIAVGEKTADVKITAPTGAKVEYVSVWDMETNDPATTFESGKNYFVNVRLTPEEGYTFRRYDNATLNGEEAYYSMVLGYEADVDFPVSFGKAEDKLSVTIDEPKVGGEITAPTIPQNANYEVDYWSYHDCHTGESLTEGKFQAGHKYQLNVNLVPKNGGRFDEQTKLFFNGKEVDDNYISRMNASLEQEFSFAQELQKVELPAWPGLKAGDPLKGVSGVSDDGKYFYDGYWQDEDYNEIDESLLAVNGYLYDYVYWVQAAPGYDITEDTKVFVGGQEIPRAQCSYSGYDCSVELTKAYPLGLQLVDTVKLEIKEPELGKIAEPEVTVDKDEPYYVDYAYWCRGKVDDADAAKWMNPEKEAFAYGYYYYLGLIMDTDQGYAFGDKVTLVINGGELEGYVYGNYGDSLDVYIPTGLFTDNPKTGDESPVIAVAALLVLAMAGLAVTVISKKRIG